MTLGPPRLNLAMFFQIHLNQTSTPTLKLILRVATPTGKKAKTQKKSIGGLFFREVLQWDFNFHCAQSMRFCSERILCKCHPVRLSVSIIMGPLRVHPLLTECLSFSLNMIAYDCTFSSLAGSAAELQYIEISRLYSHYFAFIHVLVP